MQKATKLVARRAVGSPERSHTIEEAGESNLKGPVGEKGDAVS